jgi:hypothetical protein
VLESSDPVAAIPPGAHTSDVLTGVSCTSIARCVAVGSRAYSAPPRLFLPPTPPTYQTLTERMTGAAWQIVAAPIPSGASQGALASVSCASPSRCVAVGYSKQAGSQSQVPLIERWNGRGWSIDRGAGASGHLAGVSCASSGSCVAVGSLAEGWNGHRWSAQRLPADLGGDLGPVSCSSPTACTAANSGSSITGMALDADPAK